MTSAVKRPASSPAIACEPERLLTLAQIAKLAGVHVDTVDRWRRDFGLLVVKLGRGTIRVRLSDWRAFIETNNGPGLQSNVGPHKTYKRRRTVARRKSRP